MAILKILSRHTPSYSSLVTYILRDGKVQKAEIFTQNLRSNDIEGYVREFIENEAFRKHFRSDQVYLSHEILSFNSKDSMTPEMMKDITTEYMKLRGRESVILAAVHRDAEHVHLHACVSALKFRTGESSRLSKGELRDLKVSLQEYHRQTFPEVIHSFPEHGKGKAYLTDRLWQINHRDQRSITKQRVAEIVQKCLDNASSQNEFLSFLRDENLHHYERNGVATGIETDDMKIRFSRILDMDRFQSLPPDMTEEEKTLSEITSIREHMNSIDLDKYVTERELISSEERE